VDERSFPNAKLPDAFLIAYKAFADLAGKGSLFAITVVAARRLSAQSFGIFALGSTLGWMVAVVTDFGIQLHLARAVARQPEEAARLLGGWLRVRLWTAAGAMVLVAIGLLVSGWSAAFSTPIAVLALVYACSGLIELLHHFYRGLSRSDVESSVTVWQRTATLGCGLLALAWRPDVTLLGVAMLLPAVVTLIVSLRIAVRLGGRERSAEAFALRSDSVGHRVRPRFSGAAHRFSGAAPGLREVARPEGPPYVPWQAFRRDVWPIGAGIVLSALYFRVDVSSSSYGPAPSRWRSTMPCSGWSMRCGCFRRRSLRSRCRRSVARAISGRSRAWRCRSPALQSRPRRPRGARPAG